MLGRFVLIEEQVLGEFTKLLESTKDLEYMTKENKNFSLGHT
jgi:hypothetical protein